MARETIDIQLPHQERTLLMRYGYPFECIEQSLNACGSSGNIEIVTSSTASGHASSDKFARRRLVLTRRAGVWE